MTAEPTEITLSERLARVLVLARRGRRYWLGASVVFVLGMVVAVAMTLNVRRTFLSECTFAVRAAEKPGQSEYAETSAKRAARVKDMVYERGRLESAIRKFNLYPGVVEAQGILDAVEAMKPHVGIRARESGRYVVSFDIAEAPEIDARNVARDVTQFLAESITEDYVGGSITELKNDAAFLTKEVTTASAEIDAAVKAVTKFLAQHPEFGVDLPAGSNLGVVAKKAAGTAAEPAPTTDPVLAALYRQKLRLEADLKVTSNAPATAPGDTVTRERAVAALDAAAKAYAVAQADVVAKSAKLTPEHPDMKAAQTTAALAAAQLHDARAKLAAIDAQNTGADAAAPSESQADKLKQINAQIAAREAALAAKPAAPAAAVIDSGTEPSSPQLDLETEWQRDLRALGEARKRYDELKGKSEATQLALKASEANKASLVSIIEPAYRPTKPSKGRRAMTAMLGAASAVAFALLYALARILLEDQLSDAGDIEALGLAPALGSLANIRQAETKETKLASTRPSAPSSALAVSSRAIEDPAFEGRPLRAVAVMPSPSAPEIMAVLGDDPGPIAALRLVRHRLELLHDKGMRIFAITSPREREGKSTFAAQLTLVLSESQRARVALVEASFHRPAIARLLGFNVPAGAGLSAQVVRAMRGGSEPWTMLALGPSLHVLAEDEEQDRFPRALHSACFQDLLALLAEVYDYVIVDAPCVLNGGEANALEPTVDGMVFVARAGVSKKSDLRLALRQLGARKTVGVVLVDP